MTSQSASSIEPDNSPLMEPLLAIHSAPSLTWLADAAAGAAQRGLGVLYTLLYVSDASGRLTPVTPASGPQRSVLARLSQTLGIDVAAGKVSEAQAAEIELGVTSAIAAPLQWDGEQTGLLLLLAGPGQSKQTASAELLARHVAVAVSNLREREAGRKRGEVDAVRWVYDERRFNEELDQESRRAHRHQRPLAVLLVRILNLDELRTRYGRFLSERVLRQVAGRLDDAMRDTDFLGASERDGFGAILIEADQEGAKVAEKRILAGLQELHLADGILADIKVDVGCAAATLPKDGETAEELMAAAEARLRRPNLAQQDTTSHEDAASAV
jgi:diguanylate cyclase (GGDEF)-like protein